MAKFKIPKNYSGYSCEVTLTLTDHSGDGSYSNTVKSAGLISAIALEEYVLGKEDELGKGVAGCIAEALTRLFPCFNDGNVRDLRDAAEYTFVYVCDVYGDLIEAYNKKHEKPRVDSSDNATEETK